MERKEGMKGENKGIPNAILIIVIFHLVGLAGFLVPAAIPIFLKIVPWHLLLMFAVVAFNHKHIDGKFVFFFSSVFIGGYTVEWLGVNRHLLFGNYGYGETLGVKLLGIPLVIGINWFLLIYSTGVLMQYSRLKNMYVRTMTGGSLLVLLDLLIEPVAEKFNYWHWADHPIPLSNYICWFFVSALMLLIFEQFRFKKQSFAAPVFLLMQFIFFGILYFTIWIR